MISCHFLHQFDTKMDSSTAGTETETFEMVTVASEHHWYHAAQAAKMPFSSQL
jgi:hypothetical protein